MKVNEIKRVINKTPTKLSYTENHRIWAPEEPDKNDQFWSF